MTEQIKTKVNSTGFQLEGYRTCQGCGEATTIPTCVRCLNCGRAYCRMCTLTELINGYCPDCRAKAAELGIYDDG